MLRFFRIYVRVREYVCVCVFRFRKQGDWGKGGVRSRRGGGGEGGGTTLSKVFSLEVSYGGMHNFSSPERLLAEEARASTVYSSGLEEMGAGNEVGSWFG